MIRGLSFPDFLITCGCSILFSKASRARSRSQTTASNSKCRDPECHCRIGSTGAHDFANRYYAPDDHENADDVTEKLPIRGNLVCSWVCGFLIRFPRRFSCFASIRVIRGPIFAGSLHANVFSQEGRDVEVLTFDDRRLAFLETSARDRLELQNFLLRLNDFLCRRFRLFFHDWFFLWRN